MSEIATGAAAPAPTSTPSAPPAATAPDAAQPAAEAKAEPKPAIKLADLRAARRAATPAPTGDRPATAPAATAAQPKPAEPKTEEVKPVETDIDEKQLTTFTKINRDLRAANEKVKELQTQIEPAQKYTAALKLKAEGKHFDAIKAAGFDFDAAVAEVMGTAGEAPKVDPEIVKLREELAALRGETAQTKEHQTAAQQAAREAGINALVTKVTSDEGKQKFPFLSRSPEWVREALVGADAAYAKAVEKNGGPLTNAQKDQLIAIALEVGEEKRAAEAKLYGVELPPSKTPAQTNTPPKPAPRTITPAVRPGVTRMREQGPRTLEDIRRERRARG